MAESSFTLKFPEVGIHDANKFARSLADCIIDLGLSEVRADVVRDNPESQDFGTSLVLVLGTAAATEVSKGIQAWLHRNRGAKITILRNGDVIAENLDSKDVPQIAKAFSMPR